MITRYFRKIKNRTFIVLIAIALFLIVVLWMTFLVLHPIPPRTVIMTSGEEGQSTFELGERYRSILHKEGINLQVKPSVGSLENLARLRDPDSGVSVGFVSGGMTNEKESSNLVSLGTVYYEPFWFFIRSELYHGGVPNLQGKQVSIGPEGSATNKISHDLLRLNGIDEHSAKFLSLTAETAGDKLRNGDIDAAVIMGSWDSPVVRQLVAADGIDLVSASRADAYVALYPYFNKLVLPAGVGDMAKNRPPTPVTLVATKVSLLVRKDTHPAIQYLLLDAAEQIHSEPVIFQKAGQFPAPEAVDIPLSTQARQYYKSGKPFLQHYLPFWLGVFIEQLLLLLIPLVAVIYPLFSFLPSVYQWHIRNKIYRLYGELWLIENDLQVSAARKNNDQIISRLDRLKAKATRLKIPNSYKLNLYTLKDHIDSVRSDLEKSLLTSSSEKNNIVDKQT